MQHIINHIILGHIFFYCRKHHDNDNQICGRYHLLLASNSIFMADSLYLGTIQIWWNLNENHWYLTSTKSLICQIRANCSPFQSLNMLPFHIRLERLKLIYYSLISNFSKYYFNTGTICLLFLSSHVFNVAELNSNYLKNSKVTWP